MPDKFVLAEALAGVDPEKAKMIEEKWRDLESGFTKASQEAAEYARAREAWNQEKEQYKAALNSFQTFFDEWNRQNEAGQGQVRNKETGRFESRKESTLPVAYDPDELQAAIDARLEEYKSQIFDALNREKTQFGTEVYTNTGQMLAWERQLQGIKRMDPEADERVITDLARSKGLRDLNDAYFLAYGRKNMERIARESAAKAAEEARKEAEARVRKELAQAQVEGIGSGLGLSRQVRGAVPEVAKTRAEAESKAIQELAGRMFGTPSA